VEELRELGDLIDPNPDIRALFFEFNQHYFQGKLSGVEVKWSPKMTLCAGLCQYHKGGYCSIKLSEKLLQFRTRKEIIETLLHEMVHAYLFVTHNNRDRSGHGPEFLRHMHRINKEGHYNISVFHNFVDEVSFYRTHHWKCQQCGKLVQRAMNRAPSKHDPWWASHETLCGGNFTKIKEPEDYTQKKTKGKKKEKS